MIYTITNAIITTFSKIIKFFTCQKNKAEVTIPPQTSYKLMKEESKDDEQCAAAVKEKAALCKELMKAKSRHVEQCEREQSTLEKIDECIKISSSQSVAEAHSPCQISKITILKKKRKKTRKFIPKPSPQQILNKKLLAKRRWLFKKYTFKL